ncbi:Cyclic nucleotide-binding domain [Popillia japonica]|uniref:Cyclic nucleotide-binding domain n=1 Tax=Popillia japonica TaxID=7064 RepID=A0AAW1LW89_POPJA
MDVVPDPFINETKTEIFWNAMKKCNLFNNTSEAFQKAVMRKMQSEAFSRGDILYDLGKQADEMCFVARGNLYILSGEDGDSPIVTLGQGSLIGQMNLLYTKTTKFKVVVATYSVIYTLRKTDFWATVLRYQKLKEGSKVHAAFRERIAYAQNLHWKDEQKTAVSFVRKWYDSVYDHIVQEYVLIVTLGQGSLIGQMNLLYTKTTKFKVVVATYSVIYTLRKTDFWATVLRYQKLKEGSKVHAAFRERIAYAQNLHWKDEQKTAVSFVRKWKCLESKKILSEFKEKIKNQVIQMETAVKNEGENQVLYTYSEIHNQKSYDDIFLVTRWPWVLRANSQLLKVWNVIVLVVVIYVAILYPYLAAFTHIDILNKAVTTDTVFVIYLIDVVIQMFTSIESKTETIWHVQYILSARMEKVAFIMDIIATLPIHIYPCFVNAKGRVERIMTLLCLNRVLKIYKVDVMIRDYEKTTNMPIQLVKAVKSAIYITYLGYICAAFYYSTSCFDSAQCYEKSWVKHLIPIFEKQLVYQQERHDPLGYIWLLGFNDVLAVVTNNHPCTTVSVLEHVIQCVLSIGGIFVTNYLFADYTARHTIKYNSTMEYLEFYEAIRRFMMYIETPKYLQTRVFNQLKTNWRINEGVERVQLYTDCPVRLFNSLQVEIYAQSLAALPLFQGIDAEILNFIATKCGELNLPPREYLVYSGEQAKNMYIILEGFCSILEGIAEKRVLGPKSLINGLEACLELPSIVTVCTSTYVSILKLSTNDFKFLTAKYPEFVEIIRTSVDQEAIDRVFYRVGDYADFYKASVADEADASFFVFPTCRRDPLNIDYKNVYNASGWKIVRYVLLRRTILPYGKFLRNWEIFKAISAFIISFLTPSQWVYLYYVPQIMYVYYIVYVIGAADMYIRLHVCYYNNDGILVTHPKYTAKYYLTHAFLIDFLACFPFASVLTKLGNIETAKAVILLNCNVLLQMYRFPDAFAYTKELIYKTSDCLHQALKTVPFMLVMLSMLSSVLMYVSSRVRIFNNHLIMERSGFSWIECRDNIHGGVPHLNTSEPYIFLFTSFYYTTCLFIGTNFSQFLSWTKPEAIFSICCIVLGYVFKMYIMVGVVHSRYVGNQKLVVHRNNMVQLLEYLKDEDLPRELQTKVIDHFIHTWRITYGFQTKAMLSVFHLPLQTDFCLHSYLDTLQKVVVFEEASTSFYRHLGRQINEVYLKKDQDVVKVNDIVKVIYIVHKGEVTIYGPTGEVTIYGPTGQVFANLRQGSMFGNIDEVACTRSMILARTSMTTDLFTIRTPEFYNLLQGGYGFVYRKLQNFLLLNNLSYIKSAEEAVEVADIAIRLSVLNQVISSKFYRLVIVLVEVSACVLSSYHVSFDSHYSVYYILYILDLIHLVKIILSFYTPYEDKRGDLITDFAKIRKRYMKLEKFYLDVITVFPYEIFYLLFENEEERKRSKFYLGAIRALRGLNIYQYFTGHNFSSNTVVWTRVSLNLTYTLVFVHLGACALYTLACPAGACTTGYWIGLKRPFECGHQYLCSIYLVMSIVSSTAFPKRRVPRSLGGMAITTCAAITAVFSLVVLLGDITALVRNSVYNLSKYDFEVKEFLTLLENSFVSVPFLEKMKRYCYNLWVVGKGRQIPTLLLSCPNYLMEEIKTQAYGHHILHNVIFASCHQDFLRTIIRKMKVQKFFVGDTICHQEDINDTMYFIHKGIVDVYSVTETEEMHVDILQELDSFGIIQGLFPNTPHTHTYRSNATSIILFLTYSEWCVLLKFFPASKFEIYKNLLVMDKGTSNT